MSFLGHEIHIGEDYDPGYGLFRDLRAPAGFGTRVVTLSFLEAEADEKIDQVDKVLARTAEGVMIVISPA